MTQAGVDVTGVHDGQFLTGVQFKNVATPLCGGIPLCATETGTNLADGDIWYVGCAGFYNAIDARVTVS